MNGPAWHLQDYNEYRLTRRQRWTAVLLFGTPAAIVGYVFYGNWAVAALFAASGCCFPRFWKRRLIIRQKNMLNLQFKHALSCLSSAMTAGKSIETSFREALDDLKTIYPDPRCLIIREFSVICRRIENGEPLEAAVASFSERSHMEDITSFSEVFVTCKRTGGNLIEVMKRTAAMISDKLEINQEVDVLLAQKKFEARILLAAPVAIVAVLSFSSPEYMEPLYSGKGNLVMSASLLVLTVCYVFTQRIMRINI